MSDIVWLLGHCLHDFGIHSQPLEMNLHTH